MIICSNYHEWEVKTECTEEETLEYCLSNLRRVPSSEEWHKNIRERNGTVSNDPDYYFRGYYDLQKINGGFKFIVCKPYVVEI